MVGNICQTSKADFTKFSSFACLKPGCTRAGSWRDDLARGVPQPRRSDANLGFSCHPQCLILAMFSPLWSCIINFWVIAYLTNQLVAPASNSSGGRTGSVVTGLSRCPGAAQTEKTQIFAALMVSSPAPGFADSRGKLRMCRGAEREPKARQGLTVKPHSSPHVLEVNP